MTREKIKREKQHQVAGGVVTMGLRGSDYCWLRWVRRDHGGGDRRSFTFILFSQNKHFVTFPCVVLNEGLD